MRIGLIADTHDRVPAINALLREFLKRDVTFVLHAGDHCSPFSLKPFRTMASPWPGPSAAMTAIAKG